MTIKQYGDARQEIGTILGCAASIVDMAAADLCVNAANNLLGIIEELQQEEIT